MTTGLANYVGYAAVEVDDTLELPVVAGQEQTVADDYGLEVLTVELDDDGTSWVTFIGSRGARRRAANDFWN